MSRSAEGPRLPSLARVAGAADAAVRRFPEVAVCAALSALSAAVLVDAETRDVWWGLLRAATLGVPLFVAVTLFCERNGLPHGRRWALRAVAALALVALYLLFERWQWGNLAQRYAHLSATFHLLVAVAPFTGRDERGFWQYNRAMLFRFLLATLYAAALYAGLALALAALDNLFGVDVPPLHYLRLFCLVALLFHPLFVVAGVPHDFEALARDRSYPGGLRVFSQYVLLPLVALYVTILTAYLARVLLTGTWPSGWISYLVSGLAVVGIFSLLMVHPDRVAGGHGWIDRYARAFWIAILPSAAMVLTALWQRVDQYGTTERRYLLGVLATWLAGAALYAAITRTRRIRWIPLTLAGLGLLTFVGPWSAYAVAERSQTRRLEDILAAHGAVVDGRAAGEAVEIPFDDWEQAEAVVAYLVGHHGADAVEAWRMGAGEAAGEAEVAGEVPEAVDALSAAVDTLPELPRGLGARVEAVMAELPVRSAPSDRPFQLVAGEPTSPIPAAGYDWMVVAGEGGGGAGVGGEGGGGGGGGGGGAVEAAAAVIDGDTLAFGLSEDGRELVMRLAGREEARGSLARVLEAAEGLRADAPEEVVATGPGVETERREVPAAQLVVDLSGERWDARVALRSLTVRPGGDGAGATAEGFVVEAALLRAVGPPR